MTSLLQNSLLPLTNGTLPGQNVLGVFCVRRTEDIGLSVPILFWCDLGPALTSTYTVTAHNFTFSVKGGFQRKGCKMHNVQSGS